MQRLITKLHLERYLSSKLILCIDLAISVMASLVALIIVHLLFGGGISNRFALIWLGGATAFSLLLYYVLKTYRFIIRHSTLREIAKFVLATFGKEVLLGLSVPVFAAASSEEGIRRYCCCSISCLRSVRWSWSA